MKKNGFTLSEVLITLGIIGVVSAITIPTLIQNYRNHVVETRLQKVYSVMNQAIQRAEADYGAKELWDFEDPDFWDKYFAPYIKVLKTETIEGTTSYRLIYFTDGSLLIHKTGTTTHDYFYYPNAKNYSFDKLNNRANAGSELFLFRFCPKGYDNNDYQYHVGKGFLPYARYLKDDLSNLYKDSTYSCDKSKKSAFFCAYAIMQNGWKIPKEYPFKVK